MISTAYRLSGLGYQLALGTDYWYQLAVDSDCSLILIFFCFVFFVTIIKRSRHSISYQTACVPSKDSDLPMQADQNLHRQMLCILG